MPKRLATIVTLIMDLENDPLINETLALLGISRDKVDIVKYEKFGETYIYDKS